MLARAAHPEIESLLCRDRTTRVLVPVALASGGYVTLMNGGQDHQSPGQCGGYSCLRRLMTFWSTVAANRSYDLTFTATNPQHLRLMLPFGGGEALGTNSESSRILISIFYSNPHRLDVYFNRRRVLPLEHHMQSSNSYNFSMRKPTIDDPCGSNAFAAWENKIYVVLCGGVPGVEIRQVQKVVLSLGIELETEDFFDPHYLVRNLASLFGIPASRMRIPKIVAGSTRRRLQGGGAGADVDVDVEAEDLCADVETCGPYGACSDGNCLCADGWENAANCTEGDCLCSRQVGCPALCEQCDANSTCIQCADERPFIVDSSCIASCPANTAAVTTPSGGSTCAPCHETCGGACWGSAADQCLVCDSVGLHAYLLNGECVSRCPSSRYFTDFTDSATYRCLPCSPRCETCSGPRATDCTSCVANACSRRGSCPEGVVFPSLETRTDDVYSIETSDGKLKMIHALFPLAMWHVLLTSLWDHVHVPGKRHVVSGTETVVTEGADWMSCRRAMGAARVAGSAPSWFPQRYGRPMRYLGGYSVRQALALSELPRHGQCDWHELEHPSLPDTYTDCVGCFVAIRRSNAGAPLATGEDGSLVIVTSHRSPAVGHCVSNCQAGQYADELGVCRKCDLACRRCNGPLDSQCLDPTPNSPFVAADCGPGATRRANRCVLSCPAGKKLSGSHCSACTNYDCEMCSAVDPTRCHSCKPAPWIRPVLTVCNLNAHPVHISP